MSKQIDLLNKSAVALQSVINNDSKIPRSLFDPIKIGKNIPFFGYIEIEIGECPPFLMFSNDDDYVAKKFFWHGKNAYEAMSLNLWQYFAKSSRVVLDVGAYTGVYSLAAAQQNKKTRVYCFEPHSELPLIFRLP